MNRFLATISNWRRALLPSCREAARLQSEALDTTVSPARRGGLWLHLCVCAWCRRYGKQIRFLRRSAQENPDKFTAAAPQQLTLEARARLKQRLQEETQAGPDEA
ncbi:MAG TPA: hypothetical protein VHB20_02095 [Verrucomicrobiae bacterium]|nr:hypothetical protein [Verrucomicrobiae bacterium]